MVASVPDSTSAGAGHTIYIAGGTYDDHLSATSARAGGISIIGVTDLKNPTATPAGYGQVWLRSSLYNVVDFEVPNFTLKNISLTGTNATHELLKVASYGGFWGDRLYLYNSGRGLFLAGSGATGIRLTNCLGKGSGSTDAALKFAAGSSGRIENSIFTNSDTMPLSTGTGAVGLLSQSDGTVVVNNSVITGVDNIAVAQTGTGSTTITNSIVGAGAAGTGVVVGTREAGTLSFSNCLLLPSWRSIPVAYFNGMVGDNNNIKAGAWLPVRRARGGFVVPCVDDSANVAYANDLATMLDQRGMKGTFFVDGYDLFNPSYFPAVQALQARGIMEIGHHTWSHSDLTVKNGSKIFDVSHGTDTITIDRSSGLISTTVDSSTLSFKDVFLSDIKAWLESKGFSVQPTALYARGGAESGQIASVAYGESIASGTATNAINLFSVDESAGFYKSEIADAKRTIEGALGISLVSLATPFGSTSAAAESAVHKSGLLASRPFYSATGGNTATLSSLNMYRIPALPATYLIGADDSATRMRVRSVLEWAAQSGGIFFFLSHSQSQISSAQWALILDLIKAEYPEITVTSAGGAINAIRSSGMWSDNSNAVCTASITPYPCCTAKGAGSCSGISMARTAWGDAGDFHLNPGSALIGAGDNSVWTGVPNAKDLAGSAITDAGGNVIIRTIGGVSVKNVDVGSYQYPTDGVTYNLNYKKLGSGSGSAMISPPGMACNTDCSVLFNSVTTLTLHAVPAANSVFEGWSGACSGTSDCVITMGSDSSVSATFTQTTTIMGDLKVVGGGIRIDSSTAVKPSCSDDSQRGTLWFYRVVTGAGDVLQVCGKDGSGNFSWKTLMQW